MGDLSNSGVTGCRVQITSDRIQMNFGQYQIRTSSAYTFTKDKWYHIYVVSDPVQRAGTSYSTIRINNAAQSLSSSGSVANKNSNYSKKFYVGSNIGSDSATADATMSHATNSVDLLGSDGTGVDAIDLMARMARLLDDQNVPEEGRWFVAPPTFYEELAQSGSKLLSVDFNAGQGSIRNGLVSSGKLRGFDMYKSNNIAATSNATGKVMAGHISSTATANTILSTEVLRDPTSFGDIVRGLHVYGAKVLREEALVSAFYVID